MRGCCIIAETMRKDYSVNGTTVGEYMRARCDGYHRAIAEGRFECPDKIVAPKSGIRRVFGEARHTAASAQQKTVKPVKETHVTLREPESTAVEVKESYESVTEFIADKLAAVRAAAPRRVSRRTPFPTGIMMLTVSFALILAIVVYSSSLISDAGSRISDLKKESVSLSDTEQSLELMLETKNDLRVIEDLAVNQIGMVKKDQIERKYITVFGGDSVILTDRQDADTALIPSLMSAISDKLSSLSEYIGR